MVTTAGESDSELIAALLKFVEQARLGVEETGLSLEDWMRTGHPAAGLLELLNSDQLVAATTKAGSILRLPPALGFAADPWLWVLGYVREALQPDVNGEAEAGRFLRFVRMEGGAVPARVRVTLFGPTVSESIKLVSGRLLPGTPQDLAIRDSEDLPPASVFECVIDVPARLTHDPNNMVWTVEDGERLEADMYETLDEQGLGQLLIAFVFCQPDTLVQEHVVAVSPLYGDRYVGLNAVPVGSGWSGTGHGKQRPAIDPSELQQVTGAIALLGQTRRVVVATRRYFQARAERSRPADSLVDYGTAIEALSGTSSGKDQGAWLKALLGSDPAWSHRVAGDFRQLKDARNSILHDGVTPPDARALVSWNRSLIENAITATVRRDAGIKPVGIFDPHRPRWPLGS